MRWTILALLLLAGCQTPPKAPVAAGPPTPPPYRFAKTVKPAYVAKAAESVSLAWTNLGPVTVQSSVDLSTWQDAGTFTTSPASFPAGKPVEFFRVVQSPTVTLAWDLDLDHSVTGYRLYSGVASGVYTNSVDAGSALSVTISVVPGVTNYFAVTAYSVAIESLFSNEATDPPRAPWTQIPANISP